MTTKSVLDLFARTSRRLVMLVLAVLIVVDVTPVIAQDRLAASADRDSPNEVGWTEPIDGLRFRLRSDKEVWQSWEAPILWLDIRNESGHAWSAQQLRSHLPFNRHGNRLQLVH